LDLSRVHVVGSSCSGKTTFARKLAAKLKVSHIELDELHWEPNWRESELDLFKNKVTNAVSGERWVVDGDYSRKLGAIVSGRATTTIWLDPPYAKILARFFARSLKRSVTRELLWNGCRETIRNSIFSKDSLLMWIINNRKSKQLKLASLEQAPPPGQSVVRLKTQREINDCLKRI
jgi:adenylate kinase family enzyme